MIAAPNALRSFRDLAASPAGSELVALDFGDRALTYRALSASVNRCARRLLAQPIRPGERVALMFDREPDLLVTALAALAAGVPFTILSRREGVSEVSAKLRAAGFKWLIASSRHGELGQEIARNADVRFCKFAALDDAGTHVPEDDLPLPDPDAEALIIFTSGSSGTPKAVRISHANIASNTLGLMQMTPLGPEDTLLHVMPLSHTNGVLNQVIAPLARGACVVILPRFEAEGFIAAMVRHRPTVVTGVPTMYQRLLPLDLPAEAISRLRLIRCGSAPLPPETQERIEAYFGKEMTVSYGQSEATCTSTSNLPGNRKVGSIGKALPGQDVCVLSPESEQLLDDGAIGEIAIRGPNVSLGYVGRPANETGQWVRTGDCGYRDADGFFFITGRLKEIIIRGGENLSPAQIENILLDGNGISAACVCASRDSDLGEVPVGFVETDHEKIDLDEINALIARRLSPSHKLRDIFVLERLPTNNVGKIDRRELARLADLDAR